MADNGPKIRRFGDPPPPLPEKASGDYETKIVLPAPRPVPWVDPAEPTPEPVPEPEPPAATDDDKPGKRSRN